MSKLLIRSIDRASISSHFGDCVISFQEPIQGEYCVDSILIPNTIYTIDSRNNKIYFTDSASGTNLIGTVASGVYTSSNITSALTTALNAQSSTTYTITLSSTTNKLTFTPASGTVAFRWGVENNDSCFRELGFNKTTQTLASTQTSDNPINLNSTLSLLVDINESKNEDIRISGTSSIDAVLYFPIVSSVGSYGIITGNQFKQHLTFNGARSLRIQFRDINGRVVNVNSDWELFLSKC